MTRPIFDTNTFWTGLTAEQQRVIGVAAIDREIVIHGCDELGDRRNRNEFDDLDDDAEDRVLSAVAAVLDLPAIDEAEFPLPGFASTDERADSDSK